MGGVAIVGASERTIWAEWLTRTIESFGYPDPVWYVNPKYDLLLGRECYPSVDDLPDVPSVGILVVAPDQALLQCERLLELGADEIVVIANGFGETGLDFGREREVRLRELCAGTKTRVIGPNCIGFARFHERLCAIAQPVPPAVRAGDVSVISQSGGLSGGVLGALSRERLGIDICYSIGNGVVFSFEDAVEWAFSRASTRLVCGVIEAIREPERLERIVAAGRADGKELILVLLGTSRDGRSAAASHTGAVIGEQRILGSYLERIGVLVAGDIGELARIAALLRVVGRPDSRAGIFVITASGGGAALTADSASRHGVPLAQLSPESTDRLREIVPPGPFIGNPLDVTAGNGPGGVKPVYDVVCADTAVGAIVEPYVLPWPTWQIANRWHRDALERVVDAVGARELPLLVISVFEQELSDWAEEFARQPRVSITSGIDATMAALARLYGVAASDGGAAAAPRTDGSAPAPDGVVGEVQGRTLLEAVGIRLPRAALAEDEDAAVAVAEEIGGTVVLKLGLEGVAHKGRFGGVRVGVSGAEAVRTAYRAIAESARKHGLADGRVPVLVAEMVFGPELLLGAVRDPVVGPSLTLAPGGWAAESGFSFGTLPLPLDDGDLDRLLERRRLAHLVGDERARALATFMAGLADAFTTGGLSAFSTVEVNPVILTSDGAVAADVLLVP